LADNSEYKYPGQLNFIDAAVDTRSGTVQARVSTPNPDGVLRAGQFVRVVVPVSENPSAIRVPQKAVQELQGKLSVFIVDAENKAQYRPIAARTRLGNDWLVDQGLQPGDT